MVRRLLPQTRHTHQLADRSSGRGTKRQVRAQGIGSYQDQIELVKRDGSRTSREGRAGAASEGVSGGARARWRARAVLRASTWHLRDVVLGEVGKRVAVGADHGVEAVERVGLKLGGGHRR